MLKHLILLISLLLLPNAAMADNPLHVVTLEAPPMVISTETGITGMAAELALEGLQRAGFDPEVELMPWKRAVFMAKHGDADALFYAVLNKERTHFFHYPNVPLFTIEIVALKRAKSVLEINPGFENLGRWKLGIGRGFSYGLKIQHFIDMAQFQKIESTTSNDINVVKLMDHRIDLLLVDRVLGKSFMKQYPGKMEFVTDSAGKMAVLDSRSAYLVFSKETQTKEDAERFSDAIRSMMKDGTYEAITSRYQ